MATDEDTTPVALRAALLRRDKTPERQKTTKSTVLWLVIAAALKKKPSNQRFQTAARLLGNRSQFERALCQLVVVDKPSPQRAKSQT
jgi:hypothetical protein